MKINFSGCTKQVSNLPVGLLDNLRRDNLQQRCSSQIHIRMNIVRISAAALIVRTKSFEVVSRRLSTAAARVRARFMSSGICSGQSGTGEGFLWVLRFPLPIFITPTAPHSSSIIRSWNNRPISGRRTKWTQLCNLTESCQFCLYSQSAVFYTFSLFVIVFGHMKCMCEGVCSETCMCCMGWFGQVDLTLVGNIGSVLSLLIASNLSIFCNNSYVSHNICNSYSCVLQFYCLLFHPIYLN
jgi:hypothetical protein